MSAHRLRVHGSVQGVGFRYFVMKRAQEFGVSGWVRNRVDGSVEALAWADEATLEAFLDTVRDGPRWGRVDRLDVVAESSVGDPPLSFDIRSTR